MYKYIKKFLFVLSLLVIPYMNSGVMAMDDEEYSAMHSRYYMGMEEEQEPATRSTYSSTLKLNAYKGLLIGTFILTCFVNPAEAAGPCYCTCAGYSAQHRCWYSGYAMENATCFKYCTSQGFKNFICQ